jgi:hypothetical protein
LLDKFARRARPLNVVTFCAAADGIALGVALGVVDTIDAIVDIRRAPIFYEIALIRSAPAIMAKAFSQCAKLFFIEGEL